MRPISHGPLGALQAHLQLGTGRLDVAAGLVVFWAGMAKKKPPRTRRSQAHLLAKRMAVVQGLMLLGHSALMICDALTQEWGVSESTVLSYMGKVRARWKAAEAEIDGVAERAALRAKAEDTYRDARAAKDFKASASLIRIMQSMTPQALAPVPVQISGSVALDLSALSDKDLDELEAAALRLPAVPIRGGAGAGPGRAREA